MTNLVALYAPLQHTRSCVSFTSLARELTQLRCRCCRNLNTNQLTGELPEMLGKLTQLTALCAPTHCIPALPHCIPCRLLRSCL
jgi:hypothetical protein